MPKRSRTPDVNEIAFRVVRESTREPDDTAPLPPAKKHRKNPAAVALGRKGGLKGGNARRDAMTPAERSESARKAAAARWRSKT